MDGIIQKSSGHGMLVRTNLFVGSLLFFISFLALTAFSFFYRAPAVIITYFTFFFIGYAFLRKSKVFHLFVYAYSINILFGIGFAIYFLLDRGNPFTLGADDKIFYELAIRLAGGDDASFESLGYKGYVLLFVFWFKVLNKIGIPYDFYFHLNIINSFFGAFVAPLVFLIGSKLYDKRVASITSYILLFYPPFIFYSCTIIRDVFVGSLLLAMIYFLFYAERSRITRICIGLAIIVLLYFVRTVSGYFALFFIACFFLLNLKHVPKEIFKSVLIILLVAVIGIQVIAFSRTPPPFNPPVTDLINHLSYKSHYYRKLMFEQSADESIGVMIRQSDNPIVISFSVVYMYLSPIPPRFTKSPEPNIVFLGIGNMIWYFFSISFLIIIFTAKEKDKGESVFRWAVVATTLFTITVINSSSGDPRHFYCMHPFIFLICVDTFYRNKKFLSQYSSFFFLLLITMTILYVLLRLLLL